MTFHTQCWCVVDGEMREERRTLLSYDAEVQVRILQSFQRPLNSTCQNLNVFTLGQTISLLGIYLIDHLPSL